MTPNSERTGAGGWAAALWMAPSSITNPSQLVFIVPPAERTYLQRFSYQDD
jgi:hypothetical protein